MWLSNVTCLFSFSTHLVHETPAKWIASEKIPPTARSSTPCQIESPPTYARRRFRAALDRFSRLITPPHPPCAAEALEPPIPQGEAWPLRLALQRVEAAAFLCLFFVDDYPFFVSFPSNIYICNFGANCDWWRLHIVRMVHWFCIWWFVSKSWWWFNSTIEIWFFYGFC
jgi:hypothetical protein